MNSAWPSRTQPGRRKLGLAVVISSRREFGLAVVISGCHDLCLPVAISGLRDLALAIVISPAVVISDKAIRAGRVVVLLNFELYM